MQLNNYLQINIFKTPNDCTNKFQKIIEPQKNWGHVLTKYTIQLQ